MAALTDYQGQMDPNSPNTLSPQTPLTGGMPPAPDSPNPLMSQPESPIFTGDSSEIAPPPMQDLASTVPPFISGEPQPVPTPAAATPPLPPPPATPLATIQAPSRGFPKKLVFFLILFLILGGIGFLAFKLFGSQLANKKEVDLTWWGLWEDETIVEPLITEYQKDHPNVRITYQPQSKQDYRERLTSSLAQNKGPDVFRYHNTWVPMMRNELSVLPSNVMTAEEFTQTFYKVAVSDMTSGKGIVGMPLMYDGLALFYNEEIFSTYSKTVPATWNELRDTAIELTIKDENGIIKQAGVGLGRTENVDHWPEILALMLIQNGADLTNPTGDLAEGAVKFYTSFSTTYGVWDETLPPSTIAFAAGKVAMYVGPSWRAFEIMDQNPNLKFKIVPIPQLPKDDPNEPDITYASYWVEGVWERSENKEAAWEFLKFLSTKESLEKLYANASRVRKFGEPYPRVDMKNSIMGDPIVGGFISLAPNAKSWYLASRTFDGPTGINSLISKYFEDALNAINNEREVPEDVLPTAATGIQQVLVQYGLIAPQPQTTEAQ